VRRFTRGLAGLAAFLLLWEAASRLGLVDARYVPPPSLVLTRLAMLLGDKEFLADTVSTLLSWAIALSVASVIGVLGGLLFGTVPGLSTVVGPIVEFLRPLPSVALIPLVISVLGSDSQAKITLAAFAATWPIMVNTIYALGDVDPHMIDAARAHRVSGLRLLSGVTLPSIAPFVLTGIRFAGSVTLIVLVSTEFLTGGSIGVGQFVYISGSTGGRMDVVLAGTLFIGLFGALANAAFLGVQRRWMPWAPTEGST
jgi:NitT/TauT family transport system permease protein